MCFGNIGPFDDYVDKEEESKMTRCGLCGKEVRDDGTFMVDHASEHNEEMERLGMSAASYIAYCRRKYGIFPR